MPEFFKRKQDPEPDDVEFADDEGGLLDEAELEAEARDYYTPAQKSAQFYTDYVVRHLRFWDSGVEMVPVAGPANQAIHARPVRRHAPVEKLVVFWQAERLGLRPVLPHWDLSETNPNAVLLRMFFVTTAPVLVPGGQVYPWRVEGIYVYGFFAPLTEGDPMYAGCTPVCMDAAENLKVEGYQFSRSLLYSKPPQDYDADAAKAIE